MVVRLAENGCLLHELKRQRENLYYNVTKKNEHFSHIEKMTIARDVANGMLHLSDKKVNIQVTKSSTILVFRNMTVLSSNTPTECQISMLS